MYCSSSRWQLTIEDISLKSTGSAGKLGIHLLLRLVPNPSAPDEGRTPWSPRLGCNREATGGNYVPYHKPLQQPFSNSLFHRTVPCRKERLLPLVSAGTTMCLVCQLSNLICRILVLNFDCSSSYCPDIVWVQSVVLVNLVLSLSERSSSSSVRQGGNKELLLYRSSVDGSDYRHRLSTFGSVSNPLI